MHNLAYALLPIEEATSSEEARNIVYDFLVNDASFMEDSNASYRFWSPICDYFRIGGRFSGDLTSQNILDEFYRKVNALQGGNPSDSYSVIFITENRAALDKIWHDLGGKYVNPLSRNAGNYNGYEDDAMIIDEEIAEKLNKIEQPDVVGNERVLDCSSDNCYWEIDDYKDLIGKAWVVVIDYHY